MQLEADRTKEKEEEEEKKDNILYKVQYIFTWCLLSQSAADDVHQKNGR